MTTLDNVTRHKLTPLSPDILTEGDRPRFMLVYQAGIANLFRVQCANLAKFGRDAVRVYQGDFRTAEAMARGAGLAGAIVHSAACNMAGDIALFDWTDDLESQPFSDKFNPVFYTVGF